MSPHPFMLVLAGRRTRLNMTYLEVAQKAGVSEASVYRALNGQSDPKFSSVVAIAAPIPLRCPVTIARRPANP